MRERADELKRDIDAILGEIEALLTDYGLIVDSDMAAVLRSYVGALYLDSKLAASRGGEDELVRIREDLLEVRSDTEARLRAEWAQRGGSTRPLQS